MTRIYVYMYEYIEQVAMKCALYPRAHSDRRKEHKSARDCSRNYICWPTISGYNLDSHQYLWIICQAYMYKL
jgi:hypothetical protein